MLRGFADPGPPRARLPVRACARVFLASLLAGLCGCTQILGLEELSGSPAADAGDPPADAGSAADAALPPDAQRLDTSCVTASIAEELGTTPVSTDLAEDTMAASCGGDGSPDQVFLWTAPTTDYYVFDTFGSEFDTVLALHDECGGTELACSNNVGQSGQSEVVRKVAGGQQVIVVVDGFAGDRGQGELHIRRVSCPDVDLEGQSFPVEQTTLGAGDDHAASCGGADVDDRAYHWVAPADGVYYFRAHSESFRPVVSLLDGPRCSDRVLGCNAAAVGEFGAEVARYLRAGQSVTVVVDGVNGNGLFTLDIGQRPVDACPAEDLPAGSDPVIAEGFTPRVLSPSCTYVSNYSGIGERFDPGDLTYRVLLNGVGEFASGSCDFIAVSAQEFALYALEGGDCSGAEIDCVVAEPANDGSGNFEATVTLVNQPEDVTRTLVVIDRQAFGTGPIEIRSECVAIASH